MLSKRPLTIAVDLRESLTSLAGLLIIVTIADASIKDCRQLIPFVHNLPNFLRLWLLRALARPFPIRIRFDPVNRLLVSRKRMLLLKSLVVYVTEVLVRSKTLVLVLISRLLVLREVLLIITCKVAKSHFSAHYGARF